MGEPYLSCLNPAARALKAQGIENPTRDQLISSALSLLNQMMTPEGLANHMREMAKRGVDGSIETIKKSMGFQLKGLCYDMLSAFHGVVIRVDDAELIEALRNTDVDSLVGDVRLPFPVMEFRWPGHPSCVVIDEEHPLVRDFLAYVLKNHMKSDFRFKDHETPNITVLSTSADGYTLQLSAQKRANVLKSDEGTCLAAPRDLDQITYLTRLAMCCLLYAQTAPDMWVGVPTTKTDGVPPPVGRILKARKTVALRAVYAAHRIASAHGEPGDSKVRGHWRIGHMRSLRDERFERNKDGSVKVIWIRPTRIHPDQPVATERKL